MLSQRRSALFARLSVAVFVLALLGGLLLPVYSDEVGWRLQGRAGLDSVDKMYDALCGPNTTLAPPFWMMPVRWYSAFFNTRFADPFYIRLSGIAYALVWVGLFALVIRTVTANAANRMATSMMVIGLASLGTFPLLLVMSRPEQPIGIAACAAVLVSMTRRGESAHRDRHWLAWLRSLGIVFLAQVAFSYHFKALFVVPVFLACIAVASRGRGATVPKIVSASLLVFLAGSAMRYWLARLACPADPLIASAMSGENLGAALTSAHSVGALVQVFGEMLHHLNIFGYVRVTAPRPDPMGYWLPPGNVSSGLSTVWASLLTIAWIPPMVIAAVGLVEGLGDAVRARRMHDRTIVALALAVSICGWMALQRIINVYEAVFILPLLLLVMIIGLSGLRPETSLKYGKLIGALAVASSCAGAANIAALAVIYAPVLFQQRLESGYVKDQPLSVSVFGHGQSRAAVLKAASACGIGAPEHQHRLLLDDVTYLVYVKSMLPDHVIAEGSKMRSPDHVPYMRNVGSDGAILSCNRVPKDLRDRAVRTGDFCCVGPPGPAPLSSPGR